MVLAAGGSRRLGRPKQFVKYRGVSLIERAVRVATAAAQSRPLVVVGYDEHRIRRAVGRRCVVVSNHDWSTGMRSSLERGLAALPQHNIGALVLTCDQPRIRVSDLRALIEGWRGAPTSSVAARYGGRLGVPAILPRRCWRAVLNAAGPDQGAGPWLKRQRNAWGVPMSRADFDVDTPADLRLPL